MKRLVPAYILSQHQQGNLTGKFNATALFVDISGFTAMTESLMQNGKEGAEVLSYVLSRVFTPAIEAIHAHKGFIATFAGDAFTALFPQDSSSPLRACAAALAMQTCFQAMGVQQTRFGGFSVAIKIGMSHGSVQWGIIPARPVHAYYFRGQAIDGCARSEHQAQTGEIVLDGAVKAQVKKTVRVREDAYPVLLSMAQAPPAPSPVTHSLDARQDVFISASVLSARSAGEFRKVVVCFVAFAETKGWQQTVARIIELSGAFGGYFAGIDFGDKGGNALVLFGAPQEREKLVRRAAGLAIALRRETDMSLRIAMTCGTMFAGFVGCPSRWEYRVAGRVINLAARIMMQADWGDIFIDKHFRDQADGTCVMHHVADFSFKGIEKAVPVYQLEKLKLKIEDKPLHKEFVGRDVPLRRLEEFVAPVYAGKCAGIVYVDGGAGIGKTRLVHEFKQRCLAAGRPAVTWLYWPCDNILRKSFNPLTAFLKRCFNQQEDAAIEENSAHFDRAWASRMAGLARVNTSQAVETAAELERRKTLLAALAGLYRQDSLYERLDAKMRYENTLHAVKHLVQAECLQQPVIIDLEDAHWLDADTHAFLHVLTRNVANWPVAIIATCRYRDDGSEVDLGLVQVDQQRIGLDALNESACLALLGSLLSTESDTIPLRTRRFILGRSEGNPFYLEQITMFLLEKHLLEKDYSLVSEELGLPDSVSEIIIARIDRLSHSLKNIIQVASVLGREFIVRVLSAMLKGESLTPLIQEGCDRQIWLPVSELKYLFKHALIHKAVYDMQLKQQLRVLHGLAAQAIENLYADALGSFYADLAYHYEKAEITDKAAWYLRKAAEIAKDSYKNQEALGFYARLLAGYSLPEQDSVDIRLEMAGVYELTGNYSEALEELAQARKRATAMQDHIGMHKAWLQMGKIASFQGNNDKARQHYQQALELARGIEDKQYEASAYYQLGSLSMDQGAYDTARELFEKQLALGKQNNDDYCIAIATGEIGSVCLYQGRYTEALKHLKQKLAIIANKDNRREYARTLGHMGVAFQKLGDYDQATACVQRQLRICREIGARRLAVVASINSGVFAGEQGDNTKSMKYYENALATSREIGEKRLAATASLNIGNILLRSGDLATALSHYEQIAECGKQLGEKRLLAMALGNIGLVHEHQLAYDKAIACYKQKMEIAREINDRYQVAVAFSLLAALHAFLGDFAKALYFYKQQLAIAVELKHKRIQAEALGNIANVHDGLDNLQEALGLYNQAITIDRELNTPLNLAKHLYHKANCLRKVTRYAEAAEACAEARDIAATIENTIYLNHATILAHKVRFKLQQGNRDGQMDTISSLSHYLSQQTDKQKIARIHYEIACMWRDIGDSEKEMRFHAVKANTMYNILWKKAEKIDYKTRLAVLKKMLG